jgi:hypothetical protein
VIRRGTTLLLRDVSFALLLAILLVATVATIAGIQSLHRLDEATHGVAMRLQIQRQRANVSEARQFLILEAAAHNPATPEPFRSRYCELAQTTLFGPPTNIEQAVENPLHYRAPRSVPYSRLGVEYAFLIVRAAEQHAPEPAMPATRTPVRRCHS